MFACWQNRAKLQSWILFYLLHWCRGCEMGIVTNSSWCMMQLQNFGFCLLKHTIKRKWICDFRGTELLLGLWSLGQEMRFYRVNAYRHEICMRNSFKCQRTIIRVECVGIQGISFQLKLIKAILKLVQSIDENLVSAILIKKVKSKLVLLDFGQYRSYLIHF